MSKPPNKGLSLYANLLGETESETPSQEQSSSTAPSQPKAPVNAALLRFQPIRRVIPSKPKPKAFSMPVTPVSSATQMSTLTATAAASVSTSKPSLADFAPTEEDEYLYAPAKRQRGGRKKKKHYESYETDWEAVYDPSRPTNVEEYLRSEERQAEIWEWKDLLYKHRKGQDGEENKSDRGSDAEYSNEEEEEERYVVPKGMNFAPPKEDGGSTTITTTAKVAELEPEAEAIINTASGDNAYAWRLALSKQSTGVVALSAPISYQPPIELESMDTAVDDNDNDDDDEGEDWDERPSFGLGMAVSIDGVDDRRSGGSSKRPGQKGFAARMMEAQGWTKGTGLGADESGITSALNVHVSRRKNASSSSGFSAVTAKITGGRKKNSGSGKFGTMGEVVVLRGMLEGMSDLKGEVEGGLGQEIGEECGEKYGRVKRVVVDVESRQVFIRFTDQISALRAVNELDGRRFNGNAIRPAYYDVDKFEAGIYT